MAQPCSVVVLAAGRGTRMKSSLPKVLHSLCGRTLLGHAITAAEGIDPANIVVVVRHERDLVAAEAIRVLPSAIVADQDDVPGTGRAVYCALEAALSQNIELGKTLVVTSGDVPLLESSTLERLVNEHEKTDASVSVVTTISDDPTGYGRILRATNGKQITKIVEHKDATDTEREVREINAGIYAFNTDFLREALSKIGQNNSQGEVYLTDTVEIAVEQGLSAVPFVLQDKWQAEGCNDLVQLATLRSVLNRRLCVRHMLAGVSIVDPDTTSIDVEVSLDADCRVEPGTQLLGTTKVETGAVVGPSSTIDNAVVRSGAYVSHSVILNAEVKEGQRIPEFTVINGSQ